MRTLATTFLFASLTFAGACASTGGKCADCDKARSVVASVAADNPEVQRLSLHCGMGADMHYCASTDAARVGTKSDDEDRKAVDMAQVVVLDEGGNVDVTVPICAQDGKPTVACGVTLKGMPREQAVAKAKAVAMAVETGLGGACTCCCK